jgi:hypothetical protein
MKLFSWFLLMLVVMNVEHGPYADDLRWNQVQEAWQDCKATSDAKSCTLFQAYCFRMVQELTFKGKLSLETGDDPEERVWKLMDDDPIQHRKGYKTQLSRFMAARNNLNDLLGKWSIKRFQYEYCAIEAGMMNSPSLAKLKMREPSTAADGEGAGRSTTDPSRICITDKALRSACQNSLVISCMMLAEGFNYKLSVVITSCSAPVAAWHSFQNRQLRSTDGSRKWLVEELEGRYRHHVEDILATMCSPSLLQELDLDIEDSSLISNDDLLEGQDVADILGGYSLALAARRWCRSLWFLRGWPCRMAGVMSDTGLKNEVLQDFKADLAAYRAMEAMPHKSVAIKSLLRRTCFNDVSVKQFVQVSHLVFKGVPGHSHTA